MVSPEKLLHFDFSPGDFITNKYVVIEKLGGGWEGEVFKVEELHTGIIRAMKLFYPHRNVKFKKSKQYITKLNKLVDSSIVMNYHSFEVVNVRQIDVAAVISEFIEGELLSAVVSRQRGKRLGYFESLHLLYALVQGVESIHLADEYHGDLHLDNILIRKFGLSFDLKVIDLHHWGDSKKGNRDEDIIKIIHVFYEVLGGAKIYSKLPYPIKQIIKGLKRSLILKEFKTITHLRTYLENMEWDHVF